MEGIQKATVKNEKTPLRDQISGWLSIFAKQVGDRMPNEDVTVLPYRQLNAIYEEYSDDMGLIGEPVASESHFNHTFNLCSTDLKLRLCRDTGTFVTCTVCDAYHARLRSCKTPLEQELLKNFRRQHLDSSVKNFISTN